MLLRHVRVCICVCVCILTCCPRGKNPHPHPVHSGAYRCTSVVLNQPNDKLPPVVFRYNPLALAVDNSWRVWHAPVRRVHPRGPKGTVVATAKGQEIRVSKTAYGKMALYWRVAALVGNQAGARRREPRKTIASHDWFASSATTKAPEGRTGTAVACCCCAKHTLRDAFWDAQLGKT